MQALPVEVLHKISQSLDLRSQRDLFLCSKHLYSNWCLQLSGCSLQWQFVSKCINIVAKALADGTHGTADVYFHAECGWHASLCIEPSYTRTLLRAKWSEHSLAYQPNYSTMPIDCLWHHLSGIPSLKYASIPICNCKSKEQ